MSVDPFEAFLGRRRRRGVARERERGQCAQTWSRRAMRTRAAAGDSGIAEEGVEGVEKQPSRVAVWLLMSILAASQEHLD